MAITSSSFTAPSGTLLYYLQTGSTDGPLLIALHGLGGSTSTFEPVLPYIPARYRIILVDFPGHGKSPLSAAETPLSVGGHVSDVGDLVAHLQAVGGDASKGKITILGHSLGAAVAMHYAAQNPNNVAGLVLLGPIQSASHIPAVRQRMLDTAANTRKQGIEFAAKLATQTNFPLDDQRPVNPAHRKAVESAVVRAQQEGYAQTCEAIVSMDHKDPDYSAITCPAVVIAGDLDIISPVARSTGLNDRLGGDSSVEIVKSGHQQILESTDAVGAAMSKLFQKAS
ncbi:unnamed protein product [Clonostachys rosea]|uniref:AB hydrolase-1 domain-containing protein n=1 Tax=Bionectria ochroleuca TaxID=29856 RepID=A0ABY6UIL4_BIOOC|nr:unnamed protein product [Clonostachys rosea]